MYKLGSPTKNIMLSPKLAEYVLQCLKMYHKIPTLRKKSSHSQVFYNRKIILENFAKFTEKHLGLSLFLVKLQVWPVTVRNINVFFRQSFAFFVLFCLSNQNFIQLVSDSRNIADAIKVFFRSAIKLRFKIVSKVDLKY